MNNMQKKKTFKQEFIRRKTELMRSSKGKLNMNEPVEIFVDNEIRRFKTRRDAMDAFLNGALRFEGTDERISSNIMVQLMLGWTKCNDYESFMD